MVYKALLILYIRSLVSLLKKACEVQVHLIVAIFSVKLLRLEILSHFPIHIASKQQGKDSAHVLSSTPVLLPYNLQPPSPPSLPPIPTPAF